VSRASGFTLVELVVVLLILGISAAAVAPAVTRREDAMTSALDRAGGLVGEARRLAVSRAVRVSLTLEPDGRYQLRQLEGDTLAVLEQGRLEFATGAGLDTDRMLTLTFDPRGTVMGDSIPLREGNRRVVLGLDRWTGASRSTDGR